MRSHQRLNFGSPGSELPSRRLNQDEWPNLAEIEGFIGKLSRAADEIKRDANGRVCGSCKHLHDSWCTERHNVDGHNLKVHYNGAVACGQHEARQH